MDWRELFKPLFGKRWAYCPRCRGEGTNGRGDWCWQCQSTGKIKVWRLTNCP